MRQEGESDRGCHREREQQPLAAPRDSVTAEERRQRKREPREPAEERDAPHPPARPRHGALAQGAVDAGERPEPLADDGDSVRTSHTAEARQRGRSVEPAQIDGVHRRTMTPAPPRRNGPRDLSAAARGPAYQ
jgi:hypothetical protein